MKGGNFSKGQGLTRDREVAGSERGRIVNWGRLQSPKKSVDTRKKNRTRICVVYHFFSHTPNQQLAVSNLEQVWVSLSPWIEDQECCCYEGDEEELEGFLSRNRERIEKSALFFESRENFYEGGSAEPTRDKNFIGMYRRRGSNPPLLCDPGWVV